MEGPGLAAWRRWCAQLDGLAGAELDGAIGAVLERAQDWPDRLRAAPGRWLRDMLEGREQPRLQVVRAIELTLLDVEIAGDRLAWVTCPWLGAVAQLHVYDERLGDAGLERFVAAAGYRGVTSLALATGISDAGARRLAGDERLGQLRSLALFRNAIGADGLAALVGASRLGPGLRRLLLGRNRLGAAGMEALARPGAIAGLELLDLDEDRLDGPAITALTLAPLLAGVRALNLSNNPIGAEGCRALAGCAALGRLEALYLHGCGLADDDVAPLLSAPGLAGLRVLTLSENRLSLASVRRVAAQRELALRELDICHNEFAAEPAELVLRAAPQLAGLRRLCL